MLLKTMRLATLHRLPEDWKFQQHRCENLNTETAALHVILYVYEFDVLPKVKSTRRNFVLLLWTLSIVLFLSTPNFSQTGSSPVM
jgi:hypothetical protein